MPLGRSTERVPKTSKTSNKVQQDASKLRKDSPAASNVHLGNGTRQDSRMKLTAAASAPNLRAARQESPLPPLPPTLPPRPPAAQYQTRPSQAALQRQRPSESSLTLPYRPPRHAVYPSYTSPPGSGYFEPDPALASKISDRMSVVVSSIDEDDQPPADDLDLEPLEPTTATTSRGDILVSPKLSSRFSKVWLYTNSRLPPYLPPLKLYIPTYPLLCLCAKHSLAVYTSSKKPPPPPNGRPASINTLIPASFRHATKAMSLTTTALDTSNHIIIAIRGTATLADWAVNTWSTPASPADFLPDAGNLVHAGFLHTARATLAPLAARLRTLLDEKPARRSASVVLTGHSAGGAVAALLYAHAISTEDSIASPLKSVAAQFKRTHCVTFGAPPVSLLPLTKPPPPPGAGPESRPARRLAKSMFLAFANEGDPVVRADPGVARSLLSLLAAPAPVAGVQTAWPVPPGTLSLAGRVVLLRGAGTSAGEQTPAAGGGSKSGGLAALLFKSAKPPAVVEGSGTAASAWQATDAQLRDVIFGDPVMHSMRVYTARIEALAVAAVTVS